MREFSVDANVGQPQVAYRETIRKRGREGRGPLRPPDRRPRPVRPRLPVGRAERAGRRAPCSRARSSAARSRREYIPAVDQGVKEALEGGVVAGYPMVDVKVELMDGSYHEVDSSEMAFKIAGSMALKEAVKRAPRRCSSRSWPSRWSCRRSSSAPSSATSPRGAAGSAAWSRAARRRGRQRPGAAVADVRLRHPVRSATQGRATFTHAVPLLSGGAELHRRGDQGEGGRLQGRRARRAH